jgi:hypothetical protein
MSEGTETGLTKLHAHDAAIAAVLPAMEYTQADAGEGDRQGTKRGKSDSDARWRTIRKALKADALEWAARSIRRQKRSQPELSRLSSIASDSLEQQKQGRRGRSCSRVRLHGLDALQA